LYKTTTTGEKRRKKKESGLSLSGKPPKKHTAIAMKKEILAPKLPEKEAPRPPAEAASQKKVEHPAGTINIPGLSGRRKKKYPIPFKRRSAEDPEGQRSETEGRRKCPRREARYLRLV